MAKKNPSTRWFFNDWVHDLALRACGVPARGLWMDMLCIAATTEPVGYVKLNGEPCSAGDLARFTGASLKSVQRWLRELETHGVFSRDPTGAIYSRRLVREGLESDSNDIAINDIGSSFDCVSENSLREISRGNAVDNEGIENPDIIQPPRVGARVGESRAQASSLLLTPLSTPLYPPTGGPGNRNRKRKASGAAASEDSARRGANYGPNGANGISWETVVDDYFRAKAEHRRPFWHQMWSSPPPDQPHCEAPTEIIQSAHKRWLVDTL